MADQEFILPVTEEEYEAGGSKFITFMPGAKVGDVQYREIECDMPDWDTAGKSIKFPVTVTEEGPDKGKDGKISTGVDSKSVWKLKELHAAIVGGDLEMKAGADGKKHPVFKPTEYAGKAAVGVWTMMKGTKGGVEGAEEVLYPKLTNILLAGSKPTTESLM